MRRQGAIMGKQTWFLNWDGVGPRKLREGGIRTPRAQGRTNPGQEREVLMLQ